MLREDWRPLGGYRRRMAARSQFFHQSPGADISPLQNYRHRFVRSLGLYRKKAIFVTIEYVQSGDLSHQLDWAFPEIEAPQIEFQLLGRLKHYANVGACSQGLEAPGVMKNHLMLSLGSESRYRAEHSSSGHTTEILR